jgi:PAS domain S-box-containing protein
MKGTHGNNEIHWRGEFPKSLTHFILEHADEGIWWLDKNNLLSAVNPEGAAIVGCSPEEMIGHSPVEFLTFSGTPVTGGKMVDKTGAHTLHRVKGRDGSVSTVVSRTIPLTGPDGTYNGAIIYMIDISEANRWTRTEQMEDELVQVKAERQLMIGILRHIPDPVLLVDRSGTVLFANDAAGEMTGTEARDLDGKMIWEVGFPCPVTEENSNTLLSAFGSRSTVRMDIDGGTPEEPLAQSYILTPVRGGDGDIPVAVLVVRGPVKTGARKTENLTRSTGEAPPAVLDRSVQDIYAALVALLSQSRDATQPDAVQDIHAELADIRRIHALLDDLLPCIESGSEEETPREVKSSAILTDAEHRLGALIKETGTSVIAGTLPALWTDPVRLKMIFSTLIENAILTRRNEPLIVRVNAKSTGTSWQFSVQDNGVGVDPLYADRLFEFPDRNLFPDAGSATRIRLAVCKRVIERNGGRIWVDSIPGQGSTFYFTIPLERYPVRHRSVDIARP